MSWNYRVVKREIEDTYEYGIHEAYYNEENDIPHSITKNSIAAYGDTLEELKEELMLRLIAFEKPVLNYEDFEME